MPLMPHRAAMQAGEVATLCVNAATTVGGTVKSAISLDTYQAKGKQARAVFVTDRPCEEIAACFNATPGRTMGPPPFMTRNRSGFSANVLSQTLNCLYEQVGMHIVVYDALTRAAVALVQETLILSQLSRLTPDMVSCRLLHRAVPHRSQQAKRSWHP